MNSSNLKKPKSQKYWYNTDVYCCVLCGKEKRYKSRVYTEGEKKTKWIDDLCWEHKL